MMKICIDAGHGGNDTGAVGPTGLLESEVNLDVCFKLEDVLGEEAIETIQTREEEEYVELGERCDIANEWGANLFISVHCNSNGPTAVGIETLYASEMGEKVAKYIQQALILAAGDVDRGIKHRGNLYVLNGTEMPAVLVEIGFISNPTTEAKLRTDDYRAIIAEGIVTGLREYVRNL